MLEKPLFTNLSPKVSNFILMALIILIYVTLCAEADIYIPAFPQMIDYFGIAENQIQLVLSVNFIGLGVASLIAGPLSDAYGRKKILLAGLLLFVLSSIGCVYTDSFEYMLFWRLIQGIAAAMPMIIGDALFFDKYSLDKASKLMSLLNSFISAAMAGAPIAGALLSDFFNWRANFIVILALGTISFLGVALFFDETLPLNKRKEFRLKSIFKSYLTILKNSTFLIYSIMACMGFSAILVCIANLSVIFVDHLGMSLEVSSYYQTSIITTFIAFSLLSIKMISRYGIDLTKDIGTILCAVGAASMICVSLIDYTSANFICLSIILIAAGSSIMCGTFMAKAMEIFPDMNGTALAITVAMKQALEACLVILSEIFFDGTIVPIAYLVAACIFLPTLAYAVLQIRKTHAK